MSRLIEECEARLRSLTPYRRIFEAYRMMFREGPYRGWRYSNQHGDEVALIDQVNFSKELFLDPLPIEDIARAFEMEPGYGTSDGALELAEIIREFEHYRAREYAAYCGEPPHTTLDGIRRAAVAIGSGVTGSLTLTIGAVASLAAAHGMDRSRVYYSVPGYGMIEEIARLYRLQSIPLVGERTDHLVSLGNLADTLDPDALAYVLTYPTNPAQTSYSSNDIASFRRLIARCQEENVFLVVDTIFQDARWTNEVAPEILSLSPDARCIVKTFGPSKDRPFACGLRVGYMIGDPRLQSHLDHLCSVMLNSANFFSKLWLALDLVFRQGRPTEESFRDFENNFLLGNHGRRVRRGDIAQRAVPLFDRYARALQHNRKVLATHIERVYEYLRDSPVFVVRHSPQFGNTLFVSLTDTHRFANDYEFFARTLVEAKVGMLVGVFFGVPEAWSELSFRVVVAAESAEWMIRRIMRIEELVGR